MPLSEKFQKILADMIEKYGKEKGEQVFYAWLNKEGLSKEAEGKSRYFFETPFLIETKDGKVIGTRGILIDSFKDLVNDICTRECLADMVEQLKERPFTVDIEHESFAGATGVEKQLNRGIIPVSKIKEAKLVQEGNNYKVEIVDELNTASNRYQEVSESIKNGFLNAYSIAYVPDRFSYKIGPDGDKIRLLDKVDLLNITYTGSPVNQRATMKQIFLNSLTDERIKEIAGRIGIKGDDMDSEMDDCMKKSMADGHSEAEAKEMCSKSLKKEEQKGGVKMAEETKPETKAETKIEEKEVMLKNYEELKAKVELGLKSLETIEEMKAKIAELEKVLNQPQFKAKTEEMKASVTEQDAKARKRDMLDFI